MSARYWWCRECGHRVRWISDRNAWVHEVHGLDHAPRPVSQKPQVPA